MAAIDLIITLYSEKPTEPLPSLLRGLFPVCKLCSGPGVDVLEPAPGIALQLFGPGAQPPAYIVTARHPIISYRVDNLQGAVDRALERGAQILEQSTDDCTGFSFCYLQFPDQEISGFFSS